MAAALRLVPGLGPLRLLPASVAGGASDDGVLGPSTAGVESAAASAEGGSRTIWGAVSGDDEPALDGCEGAADGNWDRTSGGRRRMTVRVFGGFAGVDMVGAGGVAMGVLWGRWRACSAGGDGLGRWPRQTLDRRPLLVRPGGCSGWRAAVVGGRCGLKWVAGVVQCVDANPTMGVERTWMGRGQGTRARRRMKAAGGARVRECETTLAAIALLAAAFANSSEHGFCFPGTVRGSRRFAPCSQSPHGPARPNRAGLCPRRPRPGPRRPSPAQGRVGCVSARRPSSQSTAVHASCWRCSRSAGKRPVWQSVPPPANRFPAHHGRPPPRPLHASSHPQAHHIPHCITPEPRPVSTLVSGTGHLPRALLHALVVGLHSLWPARVWRLTSATWSLSRRKRTNPSKPRFCRLSTWSASWAKAQRLVVGPSEAHFAHVHCTNQSRPHPKSCRRPDLAWHQPSTLHSHAGLRPSQFACCNPMCSCKSA